MKKKAIKKKPKKDKPLYDENGHWVEERGRIKGAIRRSFRLSPQMKDVLNAARVELSPALKKDGTPGKRPRVRYRCAACNELFAKGNVQVDHINPVVPLWKREISMTWDEIVRGIYCAKDNLQVLCSTSMIKNNGFPSCHQKKTNEEKFIRSKLLPIAELHGYPLGVGNVIAAPLDSRFNINWNIDDEINMLKAVFILYQAEKLEKIEKKNQRKIDRENKLAQISAKLKEK